MRHRVVAIGAGFGGLAASRGLAGVDVDVTVIDRDNYHGFWPLLYQVATAGLGPEDIASPVRVILAGQDNVRTRLGTVTHVDLEQRTVHLDGDREGLAYDSLVVAAGSSTSDFGTPGVDEHAFPLKTLPDAVRLRNHVLTTFQRADADAATQPSGQTSDEGAADHCRHRRWIDGSRDGGRAERVDRHQPGGGLYPPRRQPRLDRAGGDDRPPARWVFPEGDHTPSGQLRA